MVNRRRIRELKRTAYSDGACLQCEDCHLLGKTNKVANNSLL